MSAGTGTLTLNPATISVLYIFNPSGNSVAGKEKKGKPKAPQPLTGDKLTEKQLRKLEWEKKLAEEKLKKESEDSLSKAAMKAKRREQQEAQRLAKAEKSTPLVSTFSV